jgi:hypothetical protein
MAQAAAKVAAQGIEMVVVERVVEMVKGTVSLPN